MAEKELSILVRAKGAIAAAQSIGKVDSAVSKLGSTVKQGAATAAGNIAKIGLFAGGAAAGAGVAAITASIKAASDLNETQSKVNVVFGESAQRVLTFGRNAASALGMSENDAEGAAATFGNLFTAMGLATGKSTDMSLKLVTLAGDLASFNNLDPTEVLEKLRAGLTGESEPLKSLGVNINETIIKAKALEMGLVKTDVSTAELTLKQQALDEATKDLNATVKRYGAGSEQALKATVKQEKAQSDLEDATNKIPATLDAATKAQAAYALIFEQTTTAQGDFSRTSDGLANQQRILRANLANTAAVLGSSLLPKVAELAKKFNSFIVDHRSDVEAMAAQLPVLFDKVIELGGKVPWGTIGNAFQLMGSGAKAAMDAFLGAPPWLQEAIIGGWGLNKLTGGAAASIIGTLGSGLIKGVLGMNAGVVNINAGVVNGGVGGAAGAAGGSLLPSLIGGAAIGGVAAGGVLAIQDIQTGTEAGVKSGMLALLGGPAGLIGRATQPIVDQLLGTNQKLAEVSRHTNEASLEARDTKYAVDQAKDAIVRKNLSVAVYNTNKVSISARDVVSTTTLTKVLAGGIQQI